MRPTAVTIAVVLFAGLAAPQLAARSAKLPGHPAAEAQTLDLAKRLIALRSVEG